MINVCAGIRYHGSAAWSRLCRLWFQMMSPAQDDNIGIPDILVSLVQWEEVATAYGLDLLATQHFIYGNS